jgi:hypothetical protein
VSAVAALDCAIDWLLVDADAGAEVGAAAGAEVGAAADAELGADVDSDVGAEAAPDVDPELDGVLLELQAASEIPTSPRHAN